MGYRMSWIGVRSKPAAALFADLDLEVAEAVESDIPPETPVSGIELPTGWSLAIFDEAGPDEVFEPYIPRVSRDAETLILQVEEHIGHVCLQCHRNGKQVWMILFDPDYTDGELNIEGDFPPDLRPQLEKLIADDPAEAPIILAEQLTGYRFDAVVDALPYKVLDRVQTPTRLARAIELGQGKPAAKTDDAKGEDKPWWKIW